MKHQYDIVALVSNDLATDQRMRRCLTSLAKAGYRCLLLGRELGSSLPLDSAVPFDQERHRLRRVRGKRFYHELNRAHYQRLLELRPSSILVVDLDTMWAGARAARQLGIPWVYDAHELYVEVPELIGRPVARAAWQALAKRYIPRAAKCYTVGEAIATEHQRRYGSAFEVVRNLTDAQPRKFATATEALPSMNGFGDRVDIKLGGNEGQSSGERPVIIYQGAVNRGRGLAALLQLAALTTSLDVWIVGDGDLLLELQDKALALSLTNVLFFGQVDPKNLRELSKQASLGYALMDGESLNYHLSLSNKSIDYIHAGLPSLQMDWPEYAAINEHYGCYTLLADLDIRPMQAAVKDMLEPCTYATMQAACKKAAAELTWANEEHRLVQVWRDVISPA